jgi:hypothetical protein
MSGTRANQIADARAGDLILKLYVAYLFARAVPDPTQQRAALTAILMALAPAFDDSPTDAQKADHIKRQKYDHLQSRAEKFLEIVRRVPAG